MKKKSLALFFALLGLALFIPHSLFGQEKNEKPVVEIEFSGLKKTRESYMQRKVKDFYGKTMSESFMHDLETALQGEELFSSIEFQNEEVENGIKVRVQVKERISFIVLPMFSVSSSSLSGGLFAFDTNAFGIKDTFALGGLVGKKSAFALAAFSKPAKDLTHPGYSVAASFSMGESEISNIDNETVFSYESKGFSASLSLLEQFNKYWSASIGLGAGYADFKEEKEGLESGLKGQLSASVSFNTNDWNGCFMSGEHMMVTSSLSLDKDKNLSQGASLTLRAEEPLLKKLRFLFSASASIQHDGDVTDLFDRGRIHSFTLPDNFKTDRGAATWAGFEYALFNPSLATISAYALYEAVIVEDWDDSKVFCHGPVFGSKLYLKKIALPAMSLCLAYNIPKSAFQFVFSVGMTF